MIPLTAAQTRDALRWVGWPFENRSTCACDFFSFLRILQCIPCSPGNPVSTWGCLTFLLALSLQTKRFFGLILAPLFRDGQLYGVPVNAALRLRFGHWLETRFSERSWRLYRDNYNFLLTFDILLHVLPRSQSKASLALDGRRSENGEC